MTLDYLEFGEWELSCDSCSEHESFDHTRFEEVKEWLDDNGWKSIYTGGDWEHKCPDCIEGETENDFEAL